MRRDIKPENFVLDKSRTEVYLCDFGFSTDELSGPPRQIGTVPYLAPECFGGADLIDWRLADVWAGAVVIYAISTGRYG